MYYPCQKIVLWQEAQEQAKAQLQKQLQTSFESLSSALTLVEYLEDSLAAQNEKLGNSFSSWRRSRRASSSLATMKKHLQDSVQVTRLIRYLPLD